MGVEIERKYRVKGDAWKQAGKGQLYQQGYLSSHPDRTVRVRRAGDRGYLTIKGKTAGASRAEYEYEIPDQDALALLEHLCEQPLIEKVRYRIAHEGHCFHESDYAALAGVAEWALIELRVRLPARHEVRTKVARVRNRPVKAKAPT